MRRGGARLDGKVAIVTGAGTRGPGVGTGRAASILFAREGAKVLLVDMVPENAGKTLAAIQEEGGDASVFTADVSNSADCQTMAEVAVERYGALHILFNNVGIGGPGSVVDMDEAVWDRVLNVNLKSMALTSKYVIPKMVETGGGSIINVSSVDGLRAGVWRNIPYAAAKGGVIALTRNMAVHHGRDNIRVNCVAPGLIYTPMVSDNLSEELRDLRRRIAPLGTEGTAWDVAQAVLFLASDESRWISGVVLPIDAGFLATTALSMLPYLRITSDE